MIFKIASVDSLIIYFGDKIDEKIALNVKKAYTCIRNLKNELFQMIAQATKQKPNMATNNPENQVVKSKKDMFYERLKANNPDLNTEDEESLYGTANDYMSGLDDYKSKRDAIDKNIADRFNEDPRFARFFLGSIQPGANPVSELL